MVYLYIKKNSYNVLDYPKNEAEDLQFLKDGGSIFQIEGKVLGRASIQMETQWYLKGSKSKHIVKTEG